jgi:hypothetical protein
LDKFDELLLHTIDYEIERIFGKRNANIIYDHLEANGCPRHEISREPEIFSTEMRNILGFGRSQILGAASILEEAILKALCIQLKAKLNEGSPASFADHIKNLREVYGNEKSATVQILPKKKR